MNVHSFSVGITCSPYVPAATSLPPIVTGELNEMVVFSFAPARHTSPYGTSAPHTARPRTAGRWYDTVISVRPTVCVTVAGGLGCGNVTWACAHAASAPTASAAATAAARANALAYIAPPLALSCA